MQRVSLRDFQLKAKKYMSVLPIILTTHNKAVAVVYRMNEDKLNRLVANGKKEMKKTIHEEVAKPVDGGTPPQGSLTTLGVMPKEPRPSMHSTIVYCPNCSMPCWKEYSNKHYMDNHEV